MHLWGQKPICPNRADYGHAIQYDIGSFLKNKFLSFEEWVSRSSKKCPCHKIYRVEADGLSLSNYPFKITIFFRVFEICGNFVKDWYFVNNRLIEARIKKSFCA